MLRASSFANGSFSKQQRMLLLPVRESLKKSKQRQKCLSVSNSDEDEDKDEDEDEDEDGGGGGFLHHSIQK